MSLNETKYYLRPLGYTPYPQSGLLLKDKKLLKINDIIFNSIELITQQKEKITKEYFTVDHFFKSVIKKSKKLEILADNLVTVKDSFLNSNKFYKKKKNTYFFNIKHYSR